MEELARARVLEECLEAMEQGETDLDSLAGRYPDAENEIRPLLEVVRQLRDLPRRPRPLSPQFVQELRQQLESHRVAPRD